MLEWLNCQHDLLSVFFMDFERYHALASQRLDELAAAARILEPAAGAAAAAAALAAARYEHTTQIENRLDFLSFCTNALELTKEQVDVLWNCCIESACVPAEAEIGFQWLENCRVKTSAIDIDMTRHLFSRASALPLGDLSLTGFSCIEFFFKWINWKDGRFVQHDGAFTVLSLPLFGTETLWDIALRSTAAQVGKRAVRLLTQLHHSLTPEDLGGQAKQGRVFVTSCMQSLAGAAAELRMLQPAAPTTMEESVPLLPSVTSEDSNVHMELEGDGVVFRTFTCGSVAKKAISLRVERCLTLLRLFVEEVEAKTPTDDLSDGRARRHGTAVRGTSMRISITLVGGLNAPMLEVAVDSNQTVAVLRTHVWQQLGSYNDWQPETPKMLRMITQGKELKEDWRSLADLRLREPYGIHVMVRLSPTPPRAKSAPEPAATSAPALAESKSAAGSSRGREGDEYEAAAVVDGGTMTTGDIDGVMGDADDGSDGVEISSSPGIMLADEGNHFAILFELLTLTDERLSVQAWQLLMMLPTNRAMHSRLAALTALPLNQAADWPALLHAGSSSFKLLYSLQIVDGLMLCDSESSSDSAMRASSWGAAFVSHGGLQKLLGLLTPMRSSDDLLNASRGPQRKPCLVLLLKLLCQFLLSWPSSHAETLQIASQDPPELSCVPLPPSAIGLAAAAAANRASCAAGAAGADSSTPAGWPVEQPPFSPPVWARRSFSALTAGDMGAEVRAPRFPQTLLALLCTVCSGAGESADTSASDAALLVDQPALEGSEAALNVQICREALQLLIGSVLSEPAALSAICEAPAVDSWLYATLLCCPHVEARLEVCNALYALAGCGGSASPCLVVTPAGDDRAVASSSAGISSSFEGVAGGSTASVRTALLASLLRLLPRVEDANSRCRQYFELLHAMMVADFTMGPDNSLLAESDRAQALCEQLVAMLAAHGVYERRDRPEGVDQVLLGLLQSMRLLHPYLPLPARRGLMNDAFSYLFALPNLADARALGPKAPPKCKTVETRVCALALLAEMAESQLYGDAERAELIDLLIYHQTDRVVPRTLWNYMPSTMERARTGYVGLKNLGATCYMNALMQQLYMIPEFRVEILEVEFDTSSAEQQLLKQLQIMFAYLHESEKKFFETRDLCNAWRDYDQLPINPSIQMDVDEFYNMLFEQLEGALRETAAGQLLQGLFGGTSVNRIVSKDGRTLSERQDIFYTISIEVKSKKSVLEGLAAYVEGEVLDGDNKYKCESGEYVEAVKRTCINTLPPCLFLHLKRFEFDFEAMKKVKIDDLVEFPHTINMRPYTMDALGAAAQPASGASGKTSVASAASAGGSSTSVADYAGNAVADDAVALAAGQLYELVGVLVHSGTADSGHYYSYIKERRTTHATSQGSWLHFNDTVVEPFDACDIPKCCYGGVEPIVHWDAELQKHVQRMAPKPHSAYMLLYERATPHEGDGVLPTAASNQPALAATSSATPSDASATGVRDGELADAGAPAPRPAEDQNKARGSAKLIQAPRKARVPEPIIHAAWTENMQFLRDRFVFDPAHFAFIQRIVSGSLAPGTAAPALAIESTPAAAGKADLATLVELSKQSELVFRSLQLGCRFLVGTLAHAKDKSSLEAWGGLLRDGLSACLPACRWMLLEAGAAGWLRQMLLVCTVEDMRNTFSTLLLHAMSCLRLTELSHYHLKEASTGIDAPMQGAMSQSSSSTSSSDDDESSDNAPKLTRGRRPARAPSVQVALVTAPSPPPPSAPSSADQPMDVEPLDEKCAARGRTVGRRCGKGNSDGAAESGSAWVGPRRPDGERPEQLVAAAAAIRTVEALLKMVHEAPSHWRHFPQFFRVLLEFARLGVEERDFMLRTRVVTLLVDFYLGDESPLAGDDGPHHRPKRTRMGDKFTLPNLDHMVELIATLVRSSHRPANGDSPTKTPWSITPLLSMSRDDYALATCPPFIGKLLKDGLNVREMEMLLLHTCYESPQATSEVIHTILHGIDTMDVDALPPYLHVFVAVIRLSDSQHQARIHHSMHKLLRVIANNMRFRLATIACLRMLITLAAHRVTRMWLLHQAQPSNWLTEWLIGQSSDGVRTTAETLVITLLSNEMQANAELPKPAPPNHPPVPPSDAVTAESAAGSSPDSIGAGTATSADTAASGAGSSGRKVPFYVSNVYDFLLALLPICTEIARNLGPSEPTAPNKAILDELAPMRLSPYFRVLTWCVQNGAVPTYHGLGPLCALYDVQDGHHWDCDDTKRHLVTFWHSAALAPQLAALHNSALAIAAHPPTFDRLLDSFISLRPQERNIQFNREFLPRFYGLLHAAVSHETHGPACVHRLVMHRNWVWAIRYVVMESTDYTSLMPLHFQSKTPPVAQDASLSETFLALLRLSCTVPEFRKKMLLTVLGIKNEDVLRKPNVLVLLDMLMEDDDEATSHACRHDKRMFGRLIRLLSDAQLQANTRLSLVLTLMWRIMCWLNKQDGMNPEIASLKEKYNKQAWEWEERHVLHYLLDTRLFPFPREVPLEEGNVRDAALALAVEVVKLGKECSAPPAWSERWHERGLALLNDVEQVASGRECELLKAVVAWFQPQSEAGASP